MFPPAVSNFLPSYFITLLLLASTSIAALTPLTMTEFRDAFSLQDLTAPGGCNRTAPNRVPMLNVVLQVLDNVWGLARGTLQIMDELPSKRDRDLLLLFFGIRTLGNGQPETSDDLRSFNFVRSR